MDPVKKTQELTRPPLPKRFYKEVSVSQRDGAYQLLLDNRPAKTPGKNALSVTSKSLAALIANEWENQENEINPFSMPLTRLCNVILDLEPGSHDPLREELQKYVHSDAIFFRSLEPEGLYKRQTEIWDPIVEWSRQYFGCQIMLTTGIGMPEQSERLASGLSDELLRYSSYELCALHTFTSISGSVLIANYLKHNPGSNTLCWQAANLEEDWNITLWGEDEEAQRRRDNRKTEWDAAVTVLQHLT